MQSPPVAPPSRGSSPRSPEALPPRVLPAIVEPLWRAGQIIFLNERSFNARTGAGPRAAPPDGGLPGSGPRLCRGRPTAAGPPVAETPPRNARPGAGLPGPAGAVRRTVPRRGRQARQGGSGRAGRGRRVGDGQPGDAPLGRTALRRTGRGDGEPGPANRGTACLGGGRFGGRVRGWRVRGMACLGGARFGGPVGGTASLRDAGRRRVLRWRAGRGPRACRRPPRQRSKLAKTGAWSLGCSQPRAGRSTRLEWPAAAMSPVAQTWSSLRPLSAASQSAAR